MFTTDSRTENYLHQIGVQFEYIEGVPYGELHEDWRINNLGRPGQPIDEDATAEYAILMEQGSPAPAVITVAGPDGYKLLDGVQRLVAGELNELTRFNTYAVAGTTSNATLAEIRHCANSRIDGRHTPDKSFFLREGVTVLHFEHGMSAEELGRALGYRVEQVREEIRFQTTSRYMQSVGYDGKLLTSKWFCAKVGECADVKDWEMAADPLHKALRVFEKCRFRNGTANHLIEDLFKIKRQQRKDRHEQFDKKLRELKKAPEVVQRMKGKRQTDIENAVPALRRAVTTLEKAAEKDQVVHDSEYATQMAEEVRKIYSLCKRLVPREMQYGPGKRSSIFDKG